MLSKIIVFFYILVSFFTVAQPSNVEITVNEVTTESTSVGFTYQNKTNKIMSELDSMKLYKNVDGQWEIINLSYAIPEVAYRTYQNQVVWDALPLTAFDSDHEFCRVKLTEGKYKLVIGYRIYEFSKGWTPASASAEFTVEK